MEALNLPDMTAKIPSITIIARVQAQGKNPWACTRAITIRDRSLLINTGGGLV
jgi:hypothetical protein